VNQKKFAIIARATAVLALCTAGTALAHHSFSAEFDGSKPVRLTGTLTKIEWTNPHSYFYVDVRSPDGHITNWGCEGGGPGALSRRGFKRGDIKIGDTLVVDGYLAKDGSPLIDARRVKLPDGRTVYGGSPGDGGPGDNASQDSSATAPKN
jgi:N-methylhydantoinase B/oxoprolinase/acetone carboxylase alpha subunit